MSDPPSDDQDTPAASPGGQSDAVAAASLAKGSRGLLWYGMVEKARKTILRSLALDPVNRDALWLSAEMSRAAGDYAAARDTYRKILDLDPDSSAATVGAKLVGGEPGGVGGTDVAAALWCEAEASRANGDLAEALKLYRDVLAANAEHDVARNLCAVLAGHPPEKRRPDYLPWPTPFLSIRNFLSPARHREVLALTWKSRKKLGVSTLYGEGHDPDKRSSTYIGKSATGDVQTWFIPRLMELFDQSLETLNIEPFDVQSTELQLTAHHDGDFFRAHADAGQDGTTIGGRTVTFVYYYHWAPQAFTGGDLLLYDSIRYSDRSYTRIAPTDNSLVMFPSNCLHEVDRVTCNDDDFRKGRFTLNGWICRAG